MIIIIIIILKNVNNCFKDVFLYVIRNRNVHPERLQGFTLSSYYRGRKQFSYVDVNSNASSVYIITSLGHVVDEVNITHPSREYFTICEVEVYGDVICPHGTYGINCSENCFCESGSSCFVDTGACPLQCPKGFIGSYCHYGQNFTCHCEDGRCNPKNGQCLPNLDCEAGWFGPSCQYQNLATKEFLEQESSVKNEVGSCSALVNELNLKFSDAHSFSWMRFHLNSTADDLPQDFDMTLFNDKSNHTMEVKNFTFYKVDSTSLDISFICNNTAKSVNIRWRNKAHICGFYISGGRNVAFNEKAVQTSTYGTTQKSYIAMKAVDGNADPDISKFSCSHTDGNDNHPNWTLTFETPHFVNRYVIYNRNNNKDPVCSPGFFGFRCEKLCHCKNNVPCFGVTGACPDGCAVGFSGQDCQEVKQVDLMCHCKNGFCDPITAKCLLGGTCETGWFGPGCQYENLATGKHVKSAQFGNFTIDFNDRSNCSGLLNSNLTLHFFKRFSFTWMRIYLEHNGEDIRKAFKSVEFKRDMQSIDCKNVQVYKINGNVIDVTCNMTETADWLQIQWNFSVSFCKIYISGGRNVAYKQRVNQSSTYDILHLTADKAVDGNTNPDVDMKSCSHTDDKDNSPLWTLDLTNTFAVNRYVLYNRNMLKERLKGSVVRSYANNSQMFYVQLISVEDLYNETSTITYVNKVIVNASQPHLTLCEVQVFGDSVCPLGKFGFKCEKTCHCKNNVTCYGATGGCPNGCAIGYTGEDCQQETKLICLCVDGWCDPVSGGCSPGVDCESGWFGPACQYHVFNKFNIMLSNQSTSDYVKCEPPTIYKYDNHTMDIVCHGNQKANGLNIKLNGADTICGVYISGGRNIAFKQQSENSFSNGDSCLSGSDPNLSIKLDQQYLVNRYIIHRNASVKGCLKLSSFRENNQVISHTNENSSQKVSFISHPEKVDKINIFSHQVKLNLDDVEVFGEKICSEGFFGLFCEKECHCKSSSCFVVTGACLGECDVGYTGDLCQQECPPGKWGEKCSSQCNSLCSDIKSCHHVTGACIGGCFGHYKAPYCTDCDDGYWGDECNKSCSGHCSQTSCDRSTGKCQYGCNDGYIQDDCSQECLETSWGRDCQNNCSSNCVSENCHHVTGHCDGGCKEGYQLPLCNSGITYKHMQIIVPVCQEGFWGFNCSQTCSSHCRNPQNCKPVHGQCDGCVAGYRLDNCTAKCEKGSYGVDCKSPCPVNCNDSECNHEIGKCIKCKPGYYSNRGTKLEQDFCQKACVDSYYGDDCKHKCSSNCSHSDCYHDSGNCKSCIDGMEGDKCNQIIQISVAAYVVPIVLFLILAILAGIYLYRRHQQRKLFYSDGDIFATFPISARGRKKHDENKRERQNIYNNTNMNLDAKQTLIPLNLLDSYLRPLNQQYYVDQFKKIPEPRDVTFTAGMSEANRIKNRYRNICPYDHSRVHLHFNKEKQQGDYINASFIKGYKSRELFIASQGPTEACIKDFIRMLWERNIEKVIMLTNLMEEGKLKCDKYWPDMGSITFGEIQITLIAIQVYSDYTIRHLELKKHKRVRSVIQFHFTAWPDKWVPLTHWGIVDFHQRVFALKTSKATVVHCSAGVGRTGTFIGLHNAIKQGEDVGHVDFFNTAVKLRRDRMLMIQTAKQYEFLHKAAYVAFSCLNTTISSENVTEKLQCMDMQSISGLSPLQKEYDDVCKIVSELDDPHDDLSDEADIQNSAMNYHYSMQFSDLKNRFPEVSPKKTYMVTLSRDKYTGTYINAVFVPSLVRAKHYILTQLPMHATVLDFWRMITQYKASLVVEVELESTVGDKTIGKFLPSDNENYIKVQQFEINTELVERNKCWKEQIVTVVTDNVETHQLTHLKSSVTSLDADLLLQLVIKLRTLMKNKNDRIVYMCRNGAQYSGLIYLLTMLLDRMDDDHQVSIPLVVGSGKSIRPQIIPSLDQYRCLYEVIQAYLQSSHSACHYVNVGLINKPAGDTQIESNELFDDVSCDED
ncbi:hypothetical protein Btru_017983 [Bulinus truncatus]|nr:hypothetical protein Btru_017983 [Bulinus truncatus]